MGALRWFLAADGRPKNAIETLCGHNQSDSPYFLLYERPGYLRAQLRLQRPATLPGMVSTMQYNPQTFQLKTQGVPYTINSWSLAPDGHHLGIAVTSTYTLLRSLFLYKW